MKKFLTLVLAFLLALGLVATVNAHGNQSCYRDENNDGYCTNRGACYVDENQDGACDNRPQSGQHHGHGRHH